MINEVKLKMESLQLHSCLLPACLLL